MNTISNTQISHSSQEHFINKFHQFDFIGKQEMRYLLEILKTPDINSNILPEPMRIIKHKTSDGFNFDIYKQSNNANLKINPKSSNSVLSESFIGKDGKIGRKGVLNFIDPDDGDSKYVWVVSNGYVFACYQSQYKYNVVKIFRNSSIGYENIIGTPCFNIFNKKDLKDGIYVLCAFSIQEKEVWLETLMNNIE
jgi:hypothetical protein